MTAKIQKLPPIVYYLLVIAGIALVFGLETAVPSLAKGLRVTPFILVSTIAAMLGSYGSGLFAILLSGIAAAYVMPPAGFPMDSSTIFKMLEFMLIAIIIFLVTWRSRRLYASNLVLKEVTKSLQDITVDLKHEAQGNELQLKNLNTTNKKLISLVNQFVEDDEYWARKITTPVAPLEKKMSHRHVEQHVHR